MRLDHAEQFEGERPLRSVQITVIATFDQVFL